MQQVTERISPLVAITLVKGSAKTPTHDLCSPPFPDRWWRTNALGKIGWTRGSTHRPSPTAKKSAGAGGGGYTWPNDNLGKFLPLIPHGNLSYTI